MDINLDILKQLIIKKYEYADFLFWEALPSPNDISIRCSVPTVFPQSSLIEPYEEHVYKHMLEIFYKEAISTSIKNFDKETKSWFSTKFAEFSFSEIIRKTLLALNEGNYRFIILPMSVYTLFLSSEIDVFSKILYEGNFNKEKIIFNDILPPFFRDKEYDHIKAYFVEGIDDVYLLQNELFDIRKANIFEIYPDLSMGQPNRNFGMSIKLNANFIHKILMYENDKVLSNHLKLKKIRVS